MTSFPIGVVSNAQPWTGKADASIQYIASAFNGNNRSDYTFTMNIGTAASNRVVVATVYTTAAGPTTRVTIGGITATKVTGYNSSGTYDISIFSAVVPTGTSATVYVELPDEAGRCAVSTYRVIPAVSSSAYSSDSGGVSSLSEQEIVGGVSVFMAIRYNSSTAYTVSRNGTALSTDQSSVYSASSLVKIGSVSVTGDANFSASATYSVDINEGAIAIAHWR